jgi:hypothetical protein
MGQQQQTMRATGSALRRMILVLGAAVLMAAMMAVSAMPAMADVGPEKPGKNGGGPPSFTGNNRDGNSGSIVLHDTPGTKPVCVAHDNGREDTGGGCP